MIALKVFGVISNFYLFFLYRIHSIENSLLGCLLESMTIIQSDYRMSILGIFGDFNGHQSE